MPAGFWPEASQKLETIPTTNDMSRADKERWANCAAVYVRMSTEHQQYSTSNQMDIIREYAKRRGFTIVKEYSDEGKSGLNIKGSVQIIYNSHRLNPLAFAGNAPTGLCSPSAIVPPHRPQIAVAAAIHEGVLKGSVLELLHFPVRYAPCSPIAPAYA